MLAAQAAQVMAGIAVFRTSLNSDISGSLHIERRADKLSSPLFVYSPLVFHQTQAGGTFSSSGRAGCDAHSLFSRRPSPVTLVRVCAFG